MAPPPDSPEASRWRRRVPLLLAAASILLLTLLAYIPALQAGFVWDDPEHFAENPDMTEHGGFVRNWLQHRHYYPMTTTTWWFMRRIFGLDPLPYHLFNILLHSLNAMLLWRIFLRLRVPGAWLAAAVFALHPVHVQSVAWATELKNCQSGLFYLIALTAWIRARDPRTPAGDVRSESTRVRHRLWYILSIVSFFFAITSKTSTVVLVAVLPLLDACLGRRWTPRTLLLAAPHLLLVVTSALITIRAQGVISQGPLWDQTLLERLALAARAVWFYLGKLAWPGELMFVYPLWQAPVADPRTWLPMAALLLLFALLLAKALRGQPGWRPALLALLYFIVALGPVLGFFRIYYHRFSWVADHWLYLASMGAIPWAIGSLTWLARRHAQTTPSWRLLSLIAAAALLLLFGQLTFMQSRIYRDNETLYLDTIANNPNVMMAYMNLAEHYQSQGDLLRTEAVLRQGLAALPDDPDLLRALGTGMVHRGRWHEALHYSRLAYRQTPDNVEVLNSLAMAEYMTGNPRQAEQYFRAALNGDPPYAQPYGNYASMLLEQGRREEAAAAVARGLKAHPGDPWLLELNAELNPDPSR